VERLINDSIGFFVTLPYGFGSLLAGGVFGMLTGGIFSPEHSSSGRFWRFLFALLTWALVLASMKIPMFVAGYSLGFAYGIRHYINGFLNWTMEIVTWFMNLVTGVVSFIIAVLFGVLKPFVWVVQTLRNGTVRSGTRPSSDSQSKAQQSSNHNNDEPHQTKNNNHDEETRREQERRAEAMKREFERRNRERAGQSKTQGNQDKEAPEQSKQEQRREAPRQEERQENKQAPRHEPPPPQKREREPAKNYEDALWYFGLDANTFTKDDLKAAHRSKTLELHPDKWGGLPEHIRKQVEDEQKTINASRDLVRKVKGWR
jgi:flagellar biosynthesis GTPase FlhF